MRFSCLYAGDSLVINAVCRYYVINAQNSVFYAVSLCSWPVLSVGIMQNNVIYLWGFCGDFSNKKEPAMKAGS